MRNYCILTIGMTAAILLLIAACTTEPETGEAESGSVSVEEKVSSEDSLETRIEIATGGCPMAEMDITYTAGQIVVAKDTVLLQRRWRNFAEEKTR